MASLRRIDPEEARKLLESGEEYTYLDVRSEEEFAAGHVPGAINIPLLRPGPGGIGMQPNADFIEDVEMALEPAARVITGCLRGARSLKAAQIMVQHGYSHVFDMRGGFDGEVDETGAVTYPGWARRGLPTTTA